MNNVVLVADDEEDVLTLVSSNLQSAGFKVVESSDGSDVVLRAREVMPALIILDLMLPQMSGFEICKVLKSDARTNGIPIIMLTARVQEIDRVLGFELGADDYVTKPFSPRELILRVKAQIRRSQTPGESGDVLQIGDIIVDRERHCVRVKNKRIELTATEFKLLTLLMERCGRVQNRETLLNEVWGYDVAIQSRTVDIHMRRLREKLGKVAEQIETVRGFGYRLVDPQHLS